MSDRQVLYVFPTIAEPLVEDNTLIIKLAKQLAWELRGDEEMLFSNTETLAGYWQGLSVQKKRRYLAAVETIIMGMMGEIDRAQALGNATKAWLQAIMKGE